MATRQGRTQMAAEVVPLTMDDVPRLHAAAHPRIDVAEIRTALTRLPGGSFWVPETGEFILVTPWRNRPELPNVHTLWSFRHDGPLIDAAVRAAADRDAAALVMLETGERRPPGFYHRHGFTRIEIIRTYEHTEPRVLARQLDPSVHHFDRVTLERRDLLEQVAALDHAAFPWFWWNSPAEFLAYLEVPQVGVWAGVRDGEAVSYIGVTVFHQWAHLDRIAVAPDRQGLGLGRAAAAFAAQRMVAGGATRIGLSTQSANRVSRHLYESMGFSHTRSSDYDVYGVILDAERALAPAGSSPASRES